ncbi:MAG: LLM class flavin-dependent oxidoreductase [Rhodospirillales bacterium]|nr:LLM class flavin-dependent oxidoreductase [Rhodospirillales bacterium]
MKIGMFINTQFPEGDPVAARVPELVEQVRVARDAGFASLLFPHHYLTAPLQMLQIGPMMAYLLREAEGMTIGGNILLLPLLNPVHVAEEAATLDVLSGGNFVLGVGLGYREGEFDAFGVSLKERAPRFSESIQLMRRLWTGERVTFEGRFYRVKDHGISLKPARPGGPPVWVAGLVEAAVKRAARIGDAWLIANATTLGATEPLMRIYRDALRAAGKQVSEFPIARECYVGASNATAMEECRAALEYKYNSYAAWGMESPTANMSFEEMARDRFIIGDKVAVKEEIARWQERLGVNHFVMRVQWPGLPQEKVLGSIRRLGEILG